MSCTFELYGQDRLDHEGQCLENENINGERITLHLALVVMYSYRYVHVAAAVHRLVGLVDTR